MLEAAFSWEAAVHLCQQHRLLRPAVLGKQALACKCGWHRVWDPATKVRGGGRSRGAAILILKPVQVCWVVCWLVVVCWARVAHVHFLSVYGPRAQHEPLDDTWRSLAGPPG